MKSFAVAFAATAAAAAACSARAHAMAVQSPLTSSSWTCSLLAPLTATSTIRTRHHELRGCARSCCSSAGDGWRHRRANDGSGMAVAGVACGARPLPPLWSRNRSSGPAMSQNARHQAASTVRGPGLRCHIQPRLRSASSTPGPGPWPGPCAACKARTIGGGAGPWSSKKPVCGGKGGAVPGAAAAQRSTSRSPWAA